MAALNQIAKEYTDEIRDGIAWVIVWKTGRSWHASAVWLDPCTDTFDAEDLATVHKILKEDPNAIMVNGYNCGHFGDMSASDIAAGILWNYENGCNLLKESAAFPPERLERPADLPTDMPWYDIETTEEIDPIVFDGHMSPEDFKQRQELIDRELAEAFTFLKAAAETACTALKTFNDTILFCTNDRPKWWHLYKHAKKARTRKKWFNRLSRQLIKDLAAINTREVIT